ncbi:hypothetical protein F5J12DRAFT_785806 [Pisolithus orientalis]|uniref:uncharacterized protein n=1 Tax=Pisolithus orientalis TaxID=936130 RepID=UPI002225413B|nr:uncharacterized protein F5J12DRAFT_785806 [Pisolithus orientalis]KAI5994625.1 hypothetical protein F5J12DRAFT_785806 [Pisolithus orientalis]
MAKPWLYAVNIQEDTEHEHACIDDKVEMVAPENTESAGPNKLINTFETYSEVDEEDEPVAYFGAMDPEDEPLEEEVVYCASIHAEVLEGQMPSEGDAPMQEDDPLIQEDSPGNNVP